MFEKEQEDGLTCNSLLADLFSIYIVHLSQEMHSSISILNRPQHCWRAQELQEMRINRFGTFKMFGILSGLSVIMMWNMFLILFNHQHRQEKSPPPKNIQKQKTTSKSTKIEQQQNIKARTTIIKNTKKKETKHTKKKKTNTQKKTHEPKQPFSPKQKSHRSAWEAAHGAAAFERKAGRAGRSGAWGAAARWVWSVGPGF